MVQFAETTRAEGTSLQITVNSRTRGIAHWDPTWNGFHLTFDGVSQFVRGGREIVEGTVRALTHAESPEKPSPNLGSSVRYGNVTRYYSHNQQRPEYNRTTRKIRTSKPGRPGSHRMEAWWLN